MKDLKKGFVTFLQKLSQVKSGPEKKTVTYIRIFYNIIDLLDYSFDKTFIGIYCDVLIDRNGIHHTMGTLF